MVERIRLLLDTRQLSPTQFADAIGIARPIVSHILSGRNKPSLEVVQRILASMPDLSMPWLLNGTGPMLAGAPFSAPANAPEPLLPPVEPAKVPTPAPIVVPLSAGGSAAKAVKNRQAPLPSTDESVGEAVSAHRAMPGRFTPKKPQPAANTAVPEAPAIQPVPATEASPLPEPLSAPIPVAEPASAPQSSTAAQLIAGSDKPIRRIVIFYRDGSFADFQPE
ncbi:helix-turn-helix domain-containing protein [Hymenobacter mellowenesis]|uniref:helix-turn-helix domain-containing protein n=1 Tax=Hymenobacter mellowenesis TaxID=3063995 RepID=UPI00350F73E9